VVVQIVVQIGPNAVTGSLHGVYVTADYGMNGVDASNNLSLAIGVPTAAGLVAVGILF